MTVFVEKIIPDSVNFYRTYVNYHSFERYLERLKWYKRGLEKRWAIQDARKRRPDPLLLRFDMFNRQVGRRDSLMKSRMLDELSTNDYPAVVAIRSCMGADE